MDNHEQKYKFYRTADIESVVIFRKRDKYQQNSTSLRNGLQCKEIRHSQAFNRDDVWCVIGLSLGLDYMIRRSTFSDANGRRKSAVFGDIYMEIYRQHAKSLTDSRLSLKELKRLCAMGWVQFKLARLNRQNTLHNPEMIDIIKDAMNYI
jgi:hypothetical protein